MVHHKFQEFLRQHPDLSASSQFDFFDSVPELSEADACNIWLSSLTALGKDSDPTVQTSSTLLREMYYVDKNNGTTRQYWDKRRIEQETERSEKEAKIQTAITVNRTTTRVMQSVNKNANRHLENFDDSFSTAAKDELGHNKSTITTRLPHESYSKACHPLPSEVPVTSAPGQTASSSEMTPSSKSQNGNARQLGKRPKEMAEEITEEAEEKSPKHADEDRPVEKRARLVTVKSTNAMQNPFLSEKDAWKDFTFFTAFGQDAQWCSASGIDYLAALKDYQHRHGADGLKHARLKPQVSNTIEDIWPSWTEVTDRVFASDVKTYRDVCKRAAAEPDQEDTIVVYVNCVLHSYMHHFSFGDVISDKVNEREAFIDTTWNFVRTALTIARIPTRMMEIQIDGNKDRKAEAKQKGSRQSTARKADGVGIYEGKQIYIAEAAQLYRATLDKKDDDAWKVKRALRDGWVSQLRQTCETHHPTKPLVVFGSTSHRDTTKFYSMDFVGCFRVSLISSMVVPLASGVGFAEKMKSCMRACLEFALMLLTEMDQREKAVFIDFYEDREELIDLAASIPATSLTPVKAKD
ncbi:hypothetical protein BGZ99_001831 [Dissophora globulifera]|uniref:Uncharacterized protein n=1 Tax=Dissophora globulifera TaxID=979702 RepID=A0A9P6QXH2_9FUNG|nr:hypothetical protein BGZ99_001831 [Dissophora globulifera]